MRCQAPTATVPSMPMSASAQLLPRGLLSCLATNLPSVLPSGRDAAGAPGPPPPPAAASPSPPPKKMSSGHKAAGRGSSGAAGADPAELARVFELFDRNGDGRITREELEDSLGRMGIPVPGDELAAMIARIDADGDGCVDLEEFGELYRAIMSGHKDGGVGGGEEEEEEQDMREAFRVFDANGDGYITVDELGAVLSSLGLKQGHTTEECRRMIGQVDRDGDGRVDFHEFLHMMRGGSFAALS